MINNIKIAQQLIRIADDLQEYKQQGLIYDRQQFLKEVKNYQLYGYLKYQHEWQEYDAYIADTNGNDHLYRMQIYVNDDGVFYEDGSLTEDDIERDEQNLQIQLLEYKYLYEKFPFSISKFKKWLNERIDKGIEQGSNVLKQYEQNKEDDNDLDSLEVGMGYVDGPNNTMIFKCDIPDYAMSYLVNDDNSGLDDQDIKEIDNWVKQNKVVSVDPTNKNDEFNSSPQFGQPCATTQCCVHIKK